MKAKPKTTAKIPEIKKPVNPPHDGVREVRQALGLTQEAIALELKCSYASVRKFESERRLPKNRAVLENLQAMAKRAGVKL